MSRGRRSIFIGNEWHIHIHGTGGKTESSGREGEVHVQREEATSTSLEDGGGGGNHILSGEHGQVAC